VADDRLDLGFWVATLAPLPDEPEVPEGDDDVEQGDATQSVPPEPISRDASEPMVLPLKEELPSKVSSRNPIHCSMFTSFAPPLASEHLLWRHVLILLCCSARSQRRQAEGLSYRRPVTRRRHPLPAFLARTFAQC